MRARKKRDPLSTAILVALVVAGLVVVARVFGPERLIYVAVLVVVWRGSLWLARRLGWDVTPTAEDMAKATDERLATRQRKGPHAPGA